MNASIELELRSPQRRGLPSLRVKNLCRLVPEVNNALNISLRFLIRCVHFNIFSVLLCHGSSASAQPLARVESPGGQGRDEWPQGHPWMGRISAWGAAGWGATAMIEAIGKSDWFNLLRL